MLATELPWRDPAAVFGHFAEDRHIAWFDSQGPVDARCRFSMIAIWPFSVLSADAEGCLLDGREIDARLDGGPMGVLAKMMARFTKATEPAETEAGSAVHGVPFTGGAAGFFGYELRGGDGKRSDTRPKRRHPALDIPDMVVGLYDLVFGFDRAEQRCWLFSSGQPEPEGARRATRAAARAQAALARLEDPPTALDTYIPAVAWRRETSQADHMAHVARTLDYIRAGDIYQANMTSRFTAQRPPGITTADFHLALRARNPAPFGAYLGCGERLAITSVSPERFVQLSAGGVIATRPIKGTRARGQTKAEDEALRHQLATSTKDRAENLMIVDLLRHDIGRVASFGSVTVPEFCTLESFAHVHHLVSEIRGMLRPGLAAMDLLRASFPGGSITGAPKIRAMQIIAELEDAERGPYCGCIAWLGFDGAMDSNIAIRTMTVTPDTIAVQAGGGIVSDSDPAEEYEEMMVKLRPLLASFGAIPA